MSIKHKNPYEAPEAEAVNVVPCPNILQTGGDPNGASRQNYEYCDLDAAN